MSESRDLREIASAISNINQTLAETAKTTARATNDIAQHLNEIWQSSVVNVLDGVGDFEYDLLKLIGSSDSVDVEKLSLEQKSLCVWFSDIGVAYTITDMHNEVCFVNKTNKTAWAIKHIDDLRKKEKLKKKEQEQEAQREASRQLSYIMIGWLFGLLGSVILKIFNI